MGKKFFTFSVVITTMLWSVGVAALVPSVAEGAVCPTLAAGDMIKVTGKAAIYSVNNDLKVLYFPSGDEFKSWRPTYGGYISITQECFDSLSVPSTYPAAVNYAPGSYVVKRPSSDQLYVVEPNNTLAKITSAAATALYGTGYKVMTVSDVFWPHYVNRGADITTSVAHPGMLVSNGGVTYYINTDNTKSVVDATGMTANGFQTKFVHAVATAAVSGLTAGTAISAEVKALTDKTQGGGITSTATTGGEAAAGTVAVALSANSPAGGQIVRDAENSVFTKATFTAGSDADVRVNTVVIGRKGLGAVSDFASVTLYDGATKLGSTRTSWDADDTITYNIPNGWTIAKGTSKEMTIVANVDTESTYNSLGINSVSVTAGAVTGLPVYGNTMTAVAVASMGTVTVTNQDASTVTKKVGTSDITLAGFRLDLSDHQGGNFQRITLKNKGTAADGDITNITLWNGTTLLAGPVSMVSDKITFVLDNPFAIARNKNADFIVKGDLVDGTANNTINFILEYNTDLSVIGTTYASDMMVSATAYNTANEGAIITISAAEMNVAYSGVALETMNDVKDVSFGTLTFSTGNTDAKITTLVLQISETPSTTGGVVADVDLFELVEVGTGSAYSGTESTGSDTTATTETWTFSDEIYLTKGVARTFTMRGDIPSTVDTNASFKVIITTVDTSSIVAETVPAGDSISGFSVGSITGKEVTVKMPYLTIENIALNNTNAVVNQKDVVLFKGTLKASAGKITVSRLKFEGATSTPALDLARLDADNFSDISLCTVDSVGVYTVQQTVTFSSLTTGYVDFNALSLVIPAGTTQTFVVKATIDATLDSLYRSVNVELDTVAAKDSDNNTVVAYKSNGTTAIEDGAELYGNGGVTLGDTGLLYVQLRNNDAGFNKDRVLLAGEGSWVGKLRLRADYEAVKIIDLKFENGNYGEEDAVKSFCMYKEQVVDSSKLVGCATFDSNDLAFFDDINYIVNIGTQDLFIYVTTNNIGNSAGATADNTDRLQFAINTTTGHLTARGESSGTDLAYGNNNGTAAAGEIVFDLDVDGSYDEAAADVGGTASSTNFYIKGSKISNVQLVSSYGGEALPAKLTGTGSTTLAILAITAAANSNTDASGNALKVGIEKLTLNFNRFASTTIDGATIKRIGGVTAAQNLTFTAYSTSQNTAVTADSWTMSAATTTLGNDAWIDAGTTAYFVIKTDVNFLDATAYKTNWIQLGLDDIKGSVDDSNNNIDWYDGYDATDTSVDIDYTFLDTENIEGTRIYSDMNS